MGRSIWLSRDFCFLGSPPDHVLISRCLDGTQGMITVSFKCVSSMIFLSFLKLSMMFLKIYGIIVSDRGERCHPRESRPLTIRESARIKTFDVLINSLVSVNLITNRLVMMCQLYLLKIGCICV